MFRSNIEVFSPDKDILFRTPGTLQQLNEHLVTFTFGNCLVYILFAVI